MADTDIPKFKTYVEGEPIPPVDINRTAGSATGAGHLANPAKRPLKNLSMIHLAPQAYFRLDGTDQRHCWHKHPLPILKDDAKAIRAATSITVITTH